MSCRRSVSTSGMLQKNWLGSWKSCAITHENGPKRMFSRKRTCKPFWLGDMPLVLLCIKLWYVRGGGTIRVMKCIILASVWARNSRLQRHLNGPKKATKLVPYDPKINENLAKCLQDIWQGFHGFLDPRVYVSGLFWPVSVPFESRITCPNGC
jgi:hypothetical protein